MYGIYVYIYIYISINTWFAPKVFIYTIKPVVLSRTSAANKIVDHSDIVGASPADAATTTSSFST